MTDTPTPTTGRAVVRSRTAAPAAMPAPAPGGHDVLMAQATAIAAAGEVIPPAYRGKPGAALVCLMWADAHGVDPWTAMEGMSFINGKRTVTAELQRALADRAGYSVRPVAVSATAATVVVTAKASGEELGRVEFTIEQAAQRGLTGRDNWRKMPDAMLVARATTTAIRWYCPGVMAGMVDADEALDADPVAVIDQPAPPVAAVADVVPLRPDQDDTVTDADVTDPAPAPPADGDAKASAATRGQAAAAYDLARQSENGPALVAAMQAENIPLAKTRWTEAQALRVIDLAADTETAPDGDGAA